MGPMVQAWFAAVSPRTSMVPSLAPSLACLLAFALAFASPSEAAADTDPGAALTLDVRAGLEGGGVGYAEGVRRSRTVVRLGGDLWLFDPADDMIGVALSWPSSSHTSALAAS